MKTIQFAIRYIEKGEIHEEYKINYIHLKLDEMVIML